MLPTLLEKELLDMETLEDSLKAALSVNAGTVTQKFLALAALAGSRGCVASLIYALKCPKI